MCIACFISSNILFIAQFALTLLSSNNLSVLKQEQLITKDCMKKYMKQMLLVAIFMLLGSLNVMRAEHNQPNTPCVKMHFAGKIGSKYALLIMGAEEESIRLIGAMATLTRENSTKLPHEYRETSKHKTLLFMATLQC